MQCGNILYEAAVLKISDFNVCYKDRGKKKEGILTEKMKRTTDERPT